MQIANCKLRVWFFLIALAVVSSGCMPFGLAMKLGLIIGDPPTFDSIEWVDIAELHSIDEIDKVLSHRLNSPSAQRHCEALISGWGKHDSWYDLIVVKFIWEHWASAYGEQHELDYERVMKLIQDRINEQPELSNQVCWYVQWKDGPWKMPRLCRWLEAQDLHGVVVEGDDFRFLLYVTGLTKTQSAQNTAVAAEWDDLSSLAFAKLQFLAGRSFLKYDDKTGRFVFDESAEKQYKYVIVEQQHMTVRKTPLPQWNGPIPVKKKTTTIE